MYPVESIREEKTLYWTTSVDVEILFDAHPEHGVTPVGFPVHEAIRDDRVIERNGLPADFDHTQLIPTRLAFLRHDVNRNAVSERGEDTVVVKVVGSGGVG